MPFSHHSHSGQFCAHAKNTLEEMVEAAIARKMRVFALTEHMPRHQADLYPEEVAAGMSEATLAKQFDDFYAEAVRLKRVYGSKIKLLVGFEGDWIHNGSRELIEQLLGKYQFDLCVGSVHHIRTIPVDFDRATYEKARGKAGGTDEALFEEYFDAQLEMLQFLKPLVVGHFDLIRLLSDKPDRDLREWPGVWKRVLRNLTFIKEHDALLELNSAGLRKGLSHPYPRAEICRAFLEMGGDFTFSDDSHGVDQIGASYTQLLKFTDDVGLEKICFFTAEMTRSNKGVANPKKSMVEISNLLRDPFWTVER